MKQIGEPKKVNARNANGGYDNVIHTVHEVEESDVNRQLPNYLGFRHKTIQFTKDDVGRQIIVMYDGKGWTCWSFN